MSDGEDPSVITEIIRERLDHRYGAVLAAGAADGDSKVGFT